MQRIAIWGRGGVVRAHAVVDDEDFERLDRYRWCLSTGGYARRVIVEGGRRRSLLMHRELLGIENRPHSVQGDHINRDRLDNRKVNLRIVTPAQNMQNQISRSGSTSRFRGVWRANTGRWRAEVKLRGVRYKLGSFEHEIDAARAAEEFRGLHMPHSLPDPELALAA
jgi:hypothetical protein